MNTIKPYANFLIMILQLQSIIPNIPIHYPKMSLIPNPTIKVILSPLIITKVCSVKTAPFDSAWLLEVEGICHATLLSSVNAYTFRYFFPLAYALTYLCLVIDGFLRVSSFASCSFLPSSSFCAIVPSSSAKFKALSTMR